MGAVICADCGATIQMRGGNWACFTGKGRWEFCCRTETRAGLLVEADYHYVEGEEQRHWRLI